MKRMLRSMIRDGARVAAWVVLLAIPTSLLLAQVYYEYRVTELGYEISEATSEKRDLTEQQRRLKIERAMQSRSERVTRVAEQRFGLRRVGPEQVWTVEAEEAADDGGESSRPLAANEQAPPTKIAQ